MDDHRDVARVAMVAEPGDSDTPHELLARGVPGHELDLLDGDPRSALTHRRYDLLHVWTPGPAGLAAQSVAHELGLPVLGRYAAATHSRDAGAFYRECRLVLSPTRGADQALLLEQVDPGCIVRWAPGVDLDRFHPARFAPEALAPGFNLLHAGPLSLEHGVDLLAEAFLIAHGRDPRLHLVFAGTGPARDRLRARLGQTASFLGPLDEEALAVIYASADLLMTAGPTGESILEAQASGLPVLAVDTGVAADLIESGRSGCLVGPDADAFASAIRGLARRGALLDRLATGGLLAARSRSWDRSLSELATAYIRTLAVPELAPKAIEVPRAA
jgi:glycosyltransferase involved in cell wall biosynthesis